MNESEAPEASGNLDRHQPAHLRKTPPTGVDAATPEPRQGAGGPAPVVDEPHHAAHRTAAGPAPDADAAPTVVTESGQDGAQLQPGAVEEPASGEPGDRDADAHSAAVAKLRRRNSKRRKPAKKRPWWIEIPILLVTAFVLTFLIQTFLFKVYYVPSGSMEQTLHGVESGGDRILVNKVVYDFRDPAPGDIVVFKGPSNWTHEGPEVAGPTNWLAKFGQAVGSVVGIEPPNETDYVKRVIAVGGQTVKCCDAGGNVQVDGVSLNEPYIYQPLPFRKDTFDCSSEPASPRCFGPVQIPDGQVWVMGDHRSNSADSSYDTANAANFDSIRCSPQSKTQCQGPVPVDNVIGKAIFIIMPFSRWDTLGNPGIDHRGG
ncbi:signal peptidase I [Nakamurella aerolata]|uniref:Signal peptidase I n=1 Tax=Nakamurella aerolata TaxID=1656892 RepID=A0A849A1Z7_9ACTN|nr:signal peptidase I [Nakamurella aerolata]NNG34585.1 signal peptidase I [Nakamurella aerolata]